MKRFIALTLGLISLLLLAACANDTNYAVSEPPASLSALHTPYIGSSHSVSRIIQVMPAPNEGWVQRFFSMETSFEPYSLSVFYEPYSMDIAETIQTLEKPISNFRSNALLLFALIDNLSEVTFAVRYTPSPASVYDDDFDYFWTVSRSEVAAMFGVGDWGELLESKDYVEDLLNVEVLFPPAISVDIEMQDAYFTYHHEGFAINIAPARDDLLAAFGHLYEFDFYESHGTEQGDSLVIWASEPLSDVWITTFHPNFEAEEFIYVLNGTHFITDSLFLGQAVVIRNYMGHGSFPWSGITFFTNTSDRQYYFAKMHNHTDTPNRFAIWPIDIKVAE